MKTFPAAAALAAFAALGPARGQEPTAPVLVREWLALDRVDAVGRHPFNPGAVLARHLLDPAAPPPEAGQELKGTSATAAWRAVAAKEDGTVEDGTGAWFFANLETDMERVVLARLEGASALFVNGEPFVGDVYRYGTGPVPVELRRGANRLFVAGPRGPWRLAFEAWKGLPSVLLPEDATSGDGVAGESTRIGLAVRVVNPSTEWAGTLPFPWLRVEGGKAAQKADPPLMPPLGIAKVPFEVETPPEAGTFEVRVQPMGYERVSRPAGPPLALPVPVRAPGDARRVTFRSSVDDSVQAYGFLPEIEDTLFTGSVGTVLSLHGAGVDALDQARAYGPKPDYRVVAPSNRRPFGFDWQDWGRRDAYEALEHATKAFRIDPSLVFLTGHSMGGHGAWHLAANDPDRWAAVAPSAGWRSFDTYGGGPRPETPLAALWRAADPGSRTEDLVANLLPLPVFVLHGRGDDNVPLSEAEAMVEALAKAGRKPLFEFREGAGHWWDGDAAPGADCVDWPGVFDLFRRSRRPWFPASVAFTSADPSVNRQEHWVRVEQPLRYGEPLRVEARRDAKGFQVRTENVRRLQVLDLGAPAVRRVVLDGEPFDVPEGEDDAAFLRSPGGWAFDPGTSPGEKDSWLSGPFKRAFDRRFVLVVGTKGTEEETRELVALARWHSQQWWYRANGNAPVARDADLLADPAAFAGRNLVLYGNEDVNAAWKALVPASCPVKVRRDEVTVGDRSWKGPGTGALFVHPRADDPGFLVGAFGSTGPRGTRLGYGLMPFTSGVGYPDYAVFGEEYLRSPDGGVLAAGWFDHGWRLQPGGFAR